MENMEFGKPKPRTTPIALILVPKLPRFSTPRAVHETVRETCGFHSRMEEIWKANKKKAVAPIDSFPPVVQQLLLCSLFRYPDS